MDKSIYYSRWNRKHNKARKFNGKICSYAIALMNEAVREGLLPENYNDVYSSVTIDRHVYTDGTTRISITGYTPEQHLKEKNYKEEL